MLQCEEDRTIHNDGNCLIFSGDIQQEISK